MYICTIVFLREQTRSFRFKLVARGGFVENIYVERVRANVKRQALYCDMLGSARG